MALPEFTLTAGPAGFSAVAGGTTLTASALAGLEVTFSVNIMGGQFLLVDGGQRWIKDVTVTLDSNGKINGNTGIKLLANDPSLDLEKPIQWTISFSRTFRHNGFKQQFTKWTFIAPNAGETKGLHELSHVTGMAATNVTRGVPGPVGVDDVIPALGDTAIQFQRDGQNVGEPFVVVNDAVVEGIATSYAIVEAASAAAETAVTNDIEGRDLIEAHTRFPPEAEGGFVGENGYATDLVFDENGEVVQDSLDRWRTRMDVPDTVDSAWYGAGFVGENGRATELIVGNDGKVPLDVLQAQANRVGSTEVTAARGTRSTLNDRLSVGLTPYGFPRDYMANEWFLRWTRMLTRKLMLGDTSTQFDIAIIGDSFSQNASRWSGPFWSAMKTQFGDAGVGWVGFSNPNNVSLQNGSVRTDTSLSVTGTWTPNYYGTLSPDLGEIASSTAGNAIVVTFPAGQTSAKLYFVGGASGSAITYAWNGNGTGATALSTVGSGLQIATLAGVGSTSTTLTLTVTGGTVTLCGVDIRNSTNGVRVHKIAATGSRASQWAAVNTASWNVGLASLAPRLVIVLHGTNDQGAGSTASQFAGYMQTIITNVQTALGATAADVAVVMPPENQRGLTQLMTNYTAAMQPVADANKAAFLDLQYVFGENPADYASGSARPWFASDNTHPDPMTGGRVMADAILRMVLGR